MTDGVARRLNCLYAALHGIHRVITRADIPDDLCRRSCDMLTTSGLFASAWIGLRGPGGCGVRAVAQTGIPLALDPCAPLSPWHEEVLISGTPCHIQMPLPDCSSQLQAPHGMAILPLHDADGVCGLLSLHAAEDHVLDTATLALLRELAEDIGHALLRLTREQQFLAAQSRIQYHASYNVQSGQPNQAALEARLPHLASLADRTGSALVLIDIKLGRIGQVEHILGHDAMDEMVRLVATRLEAFCSGEGLLAQLAQDEFALVAVLSTRDGAAGQLADRVVAALAAPVAIAGKELFLNAATGIAVYPTEETHFPFLLRRARMMLGQSGHPTDSRRQQHVEQRIDMETALHHALERNQFELHYQPQSSMKSGALVGVEALLRWRAEPDRPLVPPDQFIPILEDCGMMHAVGEWVLRTACAEAMRWRAEGLEPVRMAVNLSAQQFRMVGLADLVKQILNDTGLEPHWLELELTESIILENAEQTIQTMRELKAIGVSLSLDDFGTGYSSLSYLHRFPIDRIKIDQSFVRNLTDSTNSAALTRAILSMAHSLGLLTIAEGVETAGQFGFLRQQLCHEMQGFLFSRALPPQELILLMRDAATFELPMSFPESAFTLLLVDDEPNVLAALKRELRPEGWQILTATSARAGLEQLAIHAVGVILVDQRMAESSGTEFLAKVRRMYPDTIRILLTGYADFTNVIDAVNQGDLYKVLSKPWDSKQLRDNLREAFQRYAAGAENRRLSDLVSQLESAALRQTAGDGKVKT